jgi:hypothetical protein
LQDAADASVLDSVPRRLLCGRRARLTIALLYANLVTSTAVYRKATQVL